MEEAYKNIWTPVLQDEDRQRVTILLTTKGPSEGQNPCPILQTYTDSDITAYSLAVGTFDLSFI